MRPSFVVIALGVCASLASGCSNERRPAEWSYLSPVIFQPSCASQSCHSRSAAVAGLDFSDPDRGYKSLTALWVWVPNPTATDLETLSCGTASGQKVCEQRLRPLVTPYDPNASRLVNMLRARGASRMPPDRPLDEADIELVERWILDGAKGNAGTPADGAAPDGDGLDANDGDAAGGGVRAVDGGADAGAMTDAGGDLTQDARPVGGGDASPSAATEAPLASASGPSGRWRRVSATGSPTGATHSMYARLTLVKPVGSARAEAKFDNALVAAHGTTTQLLSNAGFDADLASWMPSFDATAMRDAADAAQSASSGSLDLVMSVGSSAFASTVAAIQCLPVSADMSYDVQADVLIVAGQSAATAAGVDLWYYASTDCSGPVLGTLATATGAGL